MMALAVKFRVFVEGQAVGDVWHHGEATEMGLDVCFVRMVRDGRSWQTMGAKRRLAGSVGRRR